MRIRMLLSLIAMLTYLSTVAATPDILVTQDGESLKVYNLDITSSDNIYYTMSENADAALQKMPKSNVLVIKKANGEILNIAVKQSQSTGKTKDFRAKRPPVTHNAVSEIKTDKKGHSFVLVGDGEGQVLNMRIISNEQKTLSVTKNKKKYDRERLIIPDSVIIDNEVYTVTEIDKDAFFHDFGNGKIKEIIFPASLKTIGAYAFSGINNLKRIDLPENLIEIGENAFFRSGGKDFENIYIPSNVSKIGKNAFRGVGNDTSPKGYTQAKIISLPDFINENNSEYYGIDDSAVEDYNERNR